MGFGPGPSSSRRKARASSAKNSGVAEQLKAYIPKLERSIQSYMTQTPPSPNSAQGIMAMWECLTMLKAAEAGT